MLSSWALFRGYFPCCCFFFSFFFPARHIIPLFRRWPSSRSEFLFVIVASTTTVTPLICCRTRLKINPRQALIGLMSCSYSLVVEGDNTTRSDLSEDFKFHYKHYSFLPSVTRSPSRFRCKDKVTCLWLPKAAFV